MISGLIIGHTVIVKSMKSRKPKAKPMAMDAMTPAHLVPDMAANPYWGPASPEEQREIVVLRTIKDDQIGTMYRRGHLGPVTMLPNGTVIPRDGSQALVLLEAARRWQTDNEAAGPVIRSSGFLQEPVDGSAHHRDGITIGQLDAKERLERYRDLFGATRGNDLIEAVLARGQSIWGATILLFPHDVTQLRRKFVATWFRECLLVLAREMKLMS